MRELEFEVYGRRLTGLAWGKPGSPRLLALHGWLDNAASFVPLADRLEGFELVALDLAGHGKSAHRSADGEYNIWSDLPDIQAVADQLGWDCFNLVGHSRGAIIACLFASTLPDRVRRIALLDGLLAPAVEPAECTRQLADFLKDKQRLLDKPGRTLASLEEGVAVRQRKGLLPDAARLLAERNLRPVEGGWCWTHDARLQGASAMKLTAGHNAAVLTGLSMPGLILLAEEGMGADPARLRDAPSSLTVETVPGGHHCHMDVSVDLIGQRIRAFMLPAEAL